MISGARPRTRMEMILTIASKDLHRSWVHLAVAGFIAGIGTFAMAGVSAGGSQCGFRGFFPSQLHWAQISPVYGIAALATSLGVGLAFADFYGTELRQGTIRALILYPIDMNDLSIAKLLSATVVGTTTSAIAFLIPMAPLVAGCYFPGEGIVAIYLGALAATLLIVYTATFASHIGADLWGRLYPSPHSSVGLLLFLAVLLTQAALNVVGIFFIQLLSAPGGQGISFETREALWNVAGGIAVLSPHHAVASVLSGVLGPWGHFPDVYVVLPIAAVVIAYGLRVGRRIPLDVFIR